MESKVILFCQPGHISDLLINTKWKGEGNNLSLDRISLSQDPNSHLDQILLSLVKRV